TPLQDGAQVAGPAGVEVLGDDDGRRKIGPQAAQQHAEGLDAAGRGADDDQRPFGRPRVTAHAALLSSWYVTRRRPRRPRASPAAGAPAPRGAPPPPPWPRPATRSSPGRAGADAPPPVAAGWRSPPAHAGPPRGRLRCPPPAPPPGCRRC